MCNYVVPKKNQKKNNNSANMTPVFEPVQSFYTNNINIIDKVFCINKLFRKYYKNKQKILLIESPFLAQSPHMETRPFFSSKPRWDQRKEQPRGVKTQPTEYSAKRSRNVQEF